MKRTFVALGALLGILALALAGCGGSATGGTSGAIEVPVTLTDFGVAPQQTTYTPGKTYRFVVKNTGATDHEFMVSPAGMAGMGAEHNSMALVRIASIPPGATKTVEYAFTSAQAGAVEIACHLPGHYEAGMHTKVTVQ